MRPAVALVALALVALALPGCTGGSRLAYLDGAARTADPPAAPPDPRLTEHPAAPAASSSSRDAAAPAQPSHAPDRPPRAHLDVQSDRLAASFTVSASDADGDRLAATLAFGDGSPPVNVTAFPSTIGHQYAAGGRVTAVLSVSDGEATATQQAAVELVAPPSGPTNQTFQATYVADNPACYGQPYDSVPQNAVTSGATYYRTNVTPGTLHHVFHVVFGSANQPFSPALTSGAYEDDIAFFDATGDLVGRWEAHMDTGSAAQWFDQLASNGTFTIPGTGSLSLHLSGFVPTGASYVVVYGCGNSLGETASYEVTGRDA